MSKEQGAKSKGQGVWSLYSLLHAPCSAHHANVP